MGEVASLLAPFLAAPQRAGILLDFDGTLAPIVDEPAEARPIAGATDALESLAARYRVVAVLSGRPVEFLQPLLPASVIMSGLYGLEVIRDGVRHDHPVAGVWREVVVDVASRAAVRGPDGMGVESKGLSLTLHYRTHPELAAEVQAWAARQAAASGLVARPARMSVELHPPIDADKGTAVEAVVREALDAPPRERRAGGAARKPETRPTRQPEDVSRRRHPIAVCFVGDDVGDLPAFDALDRLAGSGAHTLRVAVASSETPAALVDRADLVVDGPEEVLELLRRLLRESG